MEIWYVIIYPYYVSQTEDTNQTPSCLVASAFAASTCYCSSWSFKTF